MCQPEAAITDYTPLVSPSAHDLAIALFLELNQEFLFNYPLVPPPDCGAPALLEKTRELLESGEYLFVRASTEACFDTQGNPDSGAAAIIVVRKPKKVQQ